MTTWRRGAVVAVAAGLAGLVPVSSCTSSGDDPISGPTSLGGETRSVETSGLSTPPPTSLLPDHRQPLVIALNIHRPAVDLTRQTAKDVIRGRVDEWGDLGQPGGAISVARGRAAVTLASSAPDSIAVVPAARVRPTVQVARVDGIDPLVSPRRYPIQTRARTPIPQPNTVTVVGDIMLGRGVAAVTPNLPGDALAPLSHRLASADLTVGNLESTLSRAGRPRQGDDSFAADPAVIPALVHAGFDLVSLANNHTGDYGPRALVETIERIDKSRLAAVGAGRAAGQAWSPRVFERNGIRFGFLAFNAIGETPRATANEPGVAEIRMQPRTGPLDQADLRRMKRAVHLLAGEVDVVIVLPHWGQQYTHQAVPDQRRVGRTLVAAGADLVVGGHPHWTQGLQLYRGDLIVQSLGNFVFDMDFSKETREGAMLELVFWDDDLKAARLVPYVIGSDFAPRMAGAHRADAILKDIWAVSSSPFDS
jgi:poly-gamma-glutamate capsule biosynthesis protein CapA/YwtB (metallophosphatase superfamily)